MNRQNKIIRNLFLIVLLIFLICLVTGLRLTPLQAHRESERGTHYGPSEIVKVFDYKSYQHILCKYDSWVSCDTVRRFAFLFWTPGSQPAGFKNDCSYPYRFINNYSNNTNYLYGIINDKAITKIEVLTNDGQLLAEQDFYDGLFYFSWTSDDRKYGIETITGYTADNAISYTAAEASSY